MAAQGTCLNHVSRESSDINRLAQFYIESKIDCLMKMGLQIFGFEKVEAPRFEFDVIWLKLAPSFYLHLIERDPTTKLPEGPWSATSAIADPKNLPRGHHVCFTISNFDSFVQKLKEKGIEVHERTQPDGKTKQAFLFDPDEHFKVANLRSPFLLELADQPIAPQDAAMMQSVEAMVFGKNQKGGPASVMQAAAAKNERSGHVSHEDTTQLSCDEGVTVAETKLPAAATTEGDVEEAPITIGEALAATALTAGEKPVGQSDAAAIQAAEARATGSSVVTPGGLAATAPSAASANEGLAQDVDKIKLNDVLTGADAKLPADKAATRQDAQGVMEAKLRNNQSLTPYPGGVAASVAAAARLNERSS
ncbi:hypothetical protein H5410_048267 [Solanum commersonii]|uniref:VOC domain-containing protein n=1 Tax=Solanum commersonii TaxID=4109 RepID=A0A9J5XHL5_SOLCO|nr:hypothetical protein H5410_048267 [Solanum commersonii]